MHVYLMSAIGRGTYHHSWQRYSSHEACVHVYAIHVELYIQHGIWNAIQGLNNILFAHTYDVGLVSGTSTHTRTCILLCFRDLITYQEEFQAHNSVSLALTISVYGVALSGKAQQ